MEWCSKDLTKDSLENLFKHRCYEMKLICLKNIFQFWRQRCEGAARYERETV